MLLLILTSFNNHHMYLEILQRQFVLAVVEVVTVKNLVCFVDNSADQ